MNHSRGKVVNRPEHAAHAALVKPVLPSSNPSATSVVRRVKLLWTNCHWLDQSLRKQSKRCVKRVAVTIACNWGAKWIVIFKLPNDLLDLCAAEKLGRVSKTGIVASAVPRYRRVHALKYCSITSHESKVVKHTKM